MSSYIREVVSYTVIGIESPVLLISDTVLSFIAL